MVRSGLKNKTLIHHGGTEDTEKNKFEYQSLSPLRGEGEGEINKIKILLMGRNVFSKISERFLCNFYDPHPSLLPSREKGQYGVIGWTSQDFSLTNQNDNLF